MVAFFTSFFFYTLSFLFLSFFIFGFLNLHLKLCEERQKSPSTLLEITLSLTNLNTRPAAHVSVAEPSLAPGPMQTHLSLNHLLSVDHTANYIEPDQRNR